MNGTTPYFEIEGYVSDLELVNTPCWHPLFQYTDEHTARIVFDYIIADDGLPRYLEMYDDFRMLRPKPKLTPQERKQRRQARAERDARRSARQAASGRTAADPGASEPRRKRRRAPRV